MEINISPDEPSDSIRATDQDFEAKVLERSREIPVLVDFWAPWCEPCKVIGPVLEQKAKDWEGRFELVKVNMDESPMLAQVLRIQSIPTVKLFINGAIHNEFVGALPEPEILRFLEQSLPSEKAEDAVQGLQMLQMGDTAGAGQIFSRVLQNEPKNPMALIGMGHILLDQGDLDGAKEKAAAVNEAELEKLTDRQMPERLLAALKGRVFLTENAVEASEAPPPAGSIEERFGRACLAALEGDFETALDAFLDIVKKNRKFRNDGGRLAMLAVFDMLPPQSELTASYRQQLSNYLFA